MRSRIPARSDPATQSPALRRAAKIWGTATLLLADRPANHPLPLGSGVLTFWNYLLSRRRQLDAVGEFAREMSAGRAVSAIRLGHRLQGKRVSAATWATYLQLTREYAEYQTACRQLSRRRRRGG